MSVFLVFLVLLLDADQEDGMAARAMGVHVCRGQKEGGGGGGQIIGLGTAPRET